MRIKATNEVGNNGPIGVEILLKKIIKLGNEIVIDQHAYQFEISGTFWNRNTSL